MAKKKQQGHPAKAPRRGVEVPRTPEDQLAVGTLAMYEGVADLVRQAELLAVQAMREDDAEKIDELVEIHLWLRSSALGLYRSWAKLRGLPDPAEAILAGKITVEEAME